MTYPGSPSGDSGEQQPPPPHDEPVPGAYEYPPIDLNKGDLPPGNPAPPPGYSAPPADYSAPPADFSAPPPSYQSPPSGYPSPPAGYAPPPGYQPPPSGYPSPPPGYPAAPGMPPPAFPPNGHNQYQPGYGGQYPPAYGSTQPSTNNMAIASLVTSLIGIPLFFFCFVGFLCFVAGIGLGIVALSQIGKTAQKGKEMAIAGIAIGGVCIVGSILFFLLIASSANWY